MRENPAILMIICSSSVNRFMLIPLISRQITSHCKVRSRCLLGRHHGRSDCDWWDTLVYLMLNVKNNPSFIFSFPLVSPWSDWPIQKYWRRSVFSGAAYVDSFRKLLSNKSYNLFILIGSLLKITHKRVSVKTPKHPPGCLRPSSSSSNSLGGKYCANASSAIQENVIKPVAYASVICLRDPKMFGRKTSDSSGRFLLLVLPTDRIIHPT